MVLGLVLGGQLLLQLLLQVVLQGQEALRWDLVVHVFVGQVLVMVRNGRSEQRAGGRRGACGTDRTSARVLITFAVHVAAAVSGGRVALAAGSGSRAVVVRGGGGGHSGDTVSVGLYVDLDIVRMLDVLHQTPG